MLVLVVISVLVVVALVQRLRGGAGGNHSRGAAALRDPAAGASPCLASAGRSFLAHMHVFWIPPCNVQRGLPSNVRVMHSSYGVHR